MSVFFWSGNGSDDPCFFDTSGIIREDGSMHNDKSVERLASTALAYAEAGLLTTLMYTDLNQCINV